MKDTKKVLQVSGDEAIEAKNYLIKLLQDEDMLYLKNITYEDSCTRYHFCAKSDECDNICVEILRENESDCGELETFAV